LSSKIQNLILVSPSVHQCPNWT